MYLSLVLAKMKKKKKKKYPKKRNPEKIGASARVRAQTSSLQLCIISLPSERRGQPGLEEDKKTFKSPDEENNKKSMAAASNKLKQHALLLAAVWRAGT